MDSLSPHIKKTEQLLTHAHHIIRMAHPNENTTEKVKNCARLLTQENFLEIVTYIEHTKTLKDEISGCIHRLQKKVTGLTHTLYQVDKPREFFIHLKLIYEKGSAKDLSFALAYSTSRIYLVARCLQDTSSAASSANNERHFLSSLQHPSFMYTPFIQDFPSRNGPVQLILMPFCNRKDLLDSVIRDNLSLRERFNLAKQIAHALNWLHSNEIVHRDLKAENILLYNDQELKIKITDFGYTGYIEELVSHPPQLGGTYSYASPEIYQATGISNPTFTSKHFFATDVWAAGVVFFILFFDQSPFDKLTQKMIVEPALNNLPLDMPLFLKYVEMFCENIQKKGEEHSHPLLEILAKMLQFDYHKRATMSEVEAQLEKISSLPPLPLLQELFPDSSKEEVEPLQFSSPPFQENVTSYEVKRSASAL